MGVLYGGVGVDTAGFFSRVLPSSGLICLAVPNDSGGFKHRFVSSAVSAANGAATLDSQERNVYFGCASYLTNESRKGTNAALVRSLWLDVDCGEGKPYPSQREALVALKAFTACARLPAPLIVGSGNGLHLYWTLDRDLTPDEWRPLANALKHAARQLEFHADPSRTADIASVLRPVGTHHRKATPKLVKVLHEGIPATVNNLTSVLEPYLSFVKPASHGSNSDLSGGLEYPPADANLIADQCGVLNAMRSTRGNVDQPTWYHSLGVIAKCVDGERIAHAWSDGHPQYSAEETSVKFAQASQFPPTTCEKMRDFQPQICAQCPHKINSPISLGYKQPTNSIEIPSRTDESPKRIELPGGYRVGPKTGALEVLRKVDDSDEWLPFCDSVFYPVTRIHTDTGNMLEIEMLLRDNEQRRFLISTGTIAEGGKSLASELGKVEIVGRPGMKPQIEAYLARWIDRMRQEADEVETYTHFGWYDKNFLVGTQLITPGESKQVLLRGNAAIKGDAFTPTGSFEVWRDVIDRAYNYPGQEALQYQVLLGFASPLFSLFKELGGITVYAHSEGSGVGKTTAQRAALSVWGNWQELQMADGKATVNAIQALMGAYHNLPILFDELTNQNYHEASRLVFDTSSGRGRVRLNKDGTLQTNGHNWSTIMMASGNNMLTEKLASHRLNASAEIARTFEFTVHNHSRLTPNEARDLFPKLLENYGHAGQIFMDYVVKNYDKVGETLLAVQRAFNAKYDIQQSERFWSALQSCVITALKICKKTSILSFDHVALQNWIGEALQANRGQLSETVDTPAEVFGRMLSDIWQGILVTHGEGDLRRNLFADVVQHPRGNLTGRAILAVDSKEVTVLLLNATTVREWCNKYGASAKDMLAAGVNEGWINKTQPRFALGKGTTQYANITSQVRCWMVDTRKLGADSLSAPIAQRLKLVESKDDDQTNGVQRNLLGA